MGVLTVIAGVFFIFALVLGGFAAIMTL